MNVQFKNINLCLIILFQCFLCFLLFILKCSFFFSARKLLQNKGIRCIAWEEWEKASTSLPKVGQKQYEPNGSWLENNAIQNGINIRKDLLNLEKVDRVSNLATAEWLPHKKKAKVIKKSGQEWTNFGQEVDSVLYLIPEEAMFLLEMVK